MSKENQQTQPVNSGNGISDIESHAAQHMEEAPDVQEHAIAAAAANGADSTASGETAKLDKFGVKFDAAKHTGSLLKNGAWRERKNSGSALAVKKKKPVASDPNVTTELDAQSHAAGVAAAQSIIAIATMVMGAEWQPMPKEKIGYDETEMMGKAFGDYFKAKGVTDFPPGATLACVMLGYIGLRVNQPQTKQKLSGMKSWFALRFAKWKLKREFKKRNIPVVVEIRNNEILLDGKREAEWHAAAKK